MTGCTLAEADDATDDHDGAAVQLFEAYGKSLRVVVRQANGNHPQTRPAVTVAITPDTCSNSPTR